VTPGAGPPVRRLNERPEKIVPVLRPYATRIELFGSFARGEQRPDSGIDLPITPRPGIPWQQIAGMRRRTADFSR
jgi:predicted nucleotidyltransferase